MQDSRDKPAASGDRLAKVIARAGLCSRRDAEQWIAEGRVSVNGKPVRTPAFNVVATDTVEVDGQPLAQRQATRLWLYHKPEGLVVTESDPEGRPTIFEALERHGLPRVLTVGRLDINTEGLLLLTNDGGLKRILELPSTGWLRRYRVRAFGRVSQAELAKLKNGIEIEGIQYGPIEASIEREQGANTWLNIGLREGKNREVKNVLGALGLQVNRLIRISYGPFQLGDVPIGAVVAVRQRILRDQLGKRLAEEAGVDFEGPVPDEGPGTKGASIADPSRRVKRSEDGTPKIAERPARARPQGQPRRDRDAAPRSAERRPSGDRPRGRPAGGRRFEDRPRFEDRQEELPTRRVHFDDGRSEDVPYKPRRDKSDDRPGRGPKPEGGARKFGDRDRPKREGERKFGDRPPRDGDRKFGGDRKAGGDRPQRAEGGFKRGPRPQSARGEDDRPRTPRPPREGDRKFGGDRPARAEGGFKRGPRPDRQGDDRPRTPRPPREAGDFKSGRPAGGRKPAGGDRPRRGGPGGDRPSRSRGDKPRGPRKG